MTFLRNYIGVFLKLLLFFINFFKLKEAINTTDFAQYKAFL